MYWGRLSAAMQNMNWITDKTTIAHSFFFSIFSDFRNVYQGLYFLCRNAFIQNYTNLYAEKYVKAQRDTCLIRLNERKHESCGQ